MEAILSSSMEERIKDMMKVEEAKAWKSLAGYKFYMFGYHAAAWVKLNQLLPKPLPNPFRNLVRLALPYKNHSNTEIAAWKKGGHWIIRELRSDASGAVLGWQAPMEILDFMNKAAVWRE